MQIAQATEQVARRRQELESSIEALRAFERDYRARLRGFVEGQLKALEDAAPSGPWPRRSPRVSAATPGPCRVPRPAGPVDRGAPELLLGPARLQHGPARPQRPRPGRPAASRRLKSNVK